MHGVREGGDPADVAAAIVKASMDPATPLHVTMPSEFEEAVNPGGTGSFDETAASQVAMLEGTVGPRPEHS